jgi:hypothetical protein
MLISRKSKFHGEWNHKTTSEQSYYFVMFPKEEKLLWHFLVNPSAFEF